MPRSLVRFVSAAGVAAAFAFVTQFTACSTSLNSVGGADSASIDGGPGLDSACPFRFVWGSPGCGAEAPAATCELESSLCVGGRVCSCTGVVLGGCKTFVEPFSRELMGGTPGDACDAALPTDPVDAACAAPFPIDDVAIYSTNGGSCDGGAACPQGEWRWRDWSGPQDAGGCSYRGDNQCHVLCRCDADCPSTMPNCRKEHVMRGDDRAGEDNALFICEAN